VVGVGRLVDSAFDLHDTVLKWLGTALALFAAAASLFCGFNARHAARVYHHPGG
jgi:hypothetical protein